MEIELIRKLFKEKNIEDCLSIIADKLYGPEEWDLIHINYEDRIFKESRYNVGYDPLPLYLYYNYSDLIKIKNINLENLNKSVINIIHKNGISYSYGKKLYNKKLNVSVKLKPGQVLYHCTKNAPYAFYDEKPYYYCYIDFKFY